MKRLGVSVDWSREYFTMDERLSVAVREAFVRLYAQGLIYRGAYIVNWCPRCQTAISDLEVVHQEQKGHLWEIRYPVLGDGGKETGEFITVATTRPETMLGDTAVAIHPEDERYLHLHGKKLRLPLDGSRDSHRGRSLGEPRIRHRRGEGDACARSQRLRHRRAASSALHQRDGRPRAHQRERRRRTRASTATWRARKSSPTSKRRGSWEPSRTTPTTWATATAAKPWSSRASPRNGSSRFSRLAEKAIAAVRPDANGNKAIRFTPENYEKIYLNWMEDIHDWCISRQLWWGHRIPAWHCGVCHKITVPQPGATGDPAACAHCGSDKITQETDVLDTWFSSGLLPVSVFGWPISPAVSGCPGSHRGPGDRRPRRFRRLLSDLAPRHRLRHPLLLGCAHDHAGLLVLGGCSHGRRQPAPAR